MVTIDFWLFTLNILIILSAVDCGQFSWLKLQKTSPVQQSPALAPIFEPEIIDNKILTRLNGCPLSDKYDVETAGPKGPLMGEDGQYFEEMTHFTRERIPERVVHAKGYGAFGVFKPTNTQVLSYYTKAPLFTIPDVTTKIAVRFSTVIGSRGASDTVRDNRGFAIKFYTSTGNFDLLCLSIPAFFVRDPVRFIYFTHAQKPDPIGNWPVLENSFNFLVANPEALHFTMYQYSDAGTPDGFRFLPGYAINTFRLTNSTGGMVFARFRITPDGGVRNLTREQSIKISGLDPSYSSKDLYNAIEAGNYPAWTLWLQIFEFDKVADAPSEIFDSTKVWSESQYPLIEIGKFYLNRNPNNEFAEIEQLAFKPTNLMPGVNFSPDKVMQGRTIAYIDAQNYRLGANNFRLPVNSPITPIVNPTTRDGAYVCDSNQGSTPNFLPNLYSPQFKLASQFYADAWQPAEPCTVFRYNSLNDDNFSQPGQLWNSFSPKDQDALVYNLGMDLLEVSPNLQIQVIKLISLASIEFAERLTLFLKERGK